MIIPSPSNIPELPQQHRTAALIVDMLTHRNISETGAALSPSGKRPHYPLAPAEPHPSNESA
jgi:hypothetical protein